jgi:hypothetical protein
MTSSELKYLIMEYNPDAHFFDAKTMKFFGDTMRNFGTRSATIRTNYDASGNFTIHEGQEVEVWELYRRRPVKHGLKSSHFFDKAAFQEVHDANGS